MSLQPEIYMDLVRRALAEDVGSGDITTEYLDIGDIQGTAKITAKEDGVIAGLPVAEAVFRELDPSVEFKALVEDGALVRGGTLIAEARGRAASLLTAERVALNFLQQLSGIATFTYIMARAVKGSKAAVKDTRKTTPGMRLLEKYAVRMGGGQNHRMGLHDAILLKDNHIDLASGIAEAVRRVRAKNEKIPIEVETRNISEVREALEARADIIMLDNMSLIEMEDAIKEIGGRALVEVSGNVNTLNISHIASMGVDIISVGALTHSPDALDISMLFSV
ncbi:MAG: carboxylating nicotinate-nucleotide diphosphorylase [bacterium]